MDGVLVHEEHAIPGADDFLQRLVERERPFLVLTNNSIYTPATCPPGCRIGHRRAGGDDLDLRAGDRGVPQRPGPGGSAYVIGEAGLTTALHDIGYMLTDVDPDYVVLGETRTYSFEAITKAIRLIPAAPDSSRPTPTSRARPPRARCPPPGRSPR